jgi:hypothetical protein
MPYKNTRDRTQTYTGGPYVAQTPNTKSYQTGLNAFQKAETARNTPAPQPVPNTPPATTDSSLRTFTGGDSGSTYNGATAPAVPAGDPNQDYVTDSGYIAQAAALQRALEMYNADFDKQQTDYDTNLVKSFGELGWQDQDEDFFGTPDDGSWNFKDQNSSAGRGYQNQQNDFASRGLLQSSLYGTAFDNFLRQLNEQKSSMDTGRNKFRTDQSTAKQQYTNDNAFALEQAKAEAIARRASGYTL